MQGGRGWHIARLHRRSSEGRLHRSWEHTRSGVRPLGCRSPLVDVLIAYSREWPSSCDTSADGIGLRGAAIEWNAGDRVGSFLRSGRRVIPLTLLISNRWGSRFGRRIPNGRKRIQDLIASVLLPSRIGAHLERGHEVSGCEWYRWPVYCDIYVWRDAQDSIECVDFFAHADGVPWQRVRWGSWVACEIEIGRTHCGSASSGIIFWARYFARGVLASSITRRGRWQPCRNRPTFETDRCDYAEPTAGRYGNARSTGTGIGSARGGSPRT